MKINLSVVLLALFSFHPNVQAANSSKPWELRIGFGVLNTTPTEFNTQMEDFVLGNPDLEKVEDNAIDILYKMSSKPITLGVRYEIVSHDKTETVRSSSALVSAKTKLAGSRIALIAGWSFYKSDKLFAGVLGNVVAIQELEYSIESTNIASQAKTINKYTGSPEVGYGIALEGGVFVQQTANVGFEVGYTSLVSKKFSDESGEILDSSGKSIKLDLSGLYYRMHVGFFF